MNVILPASRRTIAQLTRGFFQRGQDLLLGLGFRTGRTGLVQLDKHLTGTMPRAEILGRNILSGDLPQIVVDVARTNDLKLARLGLVLKQFLSRQILAPFYDASEPVVAQAQVQKLAALSTEAEPQLVAANA